MRRGIQHQQTVVVAVKAEPFDFTLFDHVVKLFFLCDFAMGRAVRDHSLIDMIRLVIIRVAVVRCDVICAVVIGDALDPLRHRVQMDFSEVRAGCKIVFVEISAGCAVCPRAHPDRAVVRVDRDAGAFGLSAVRFKRKRAFQRQRFGIVDGDLNVFRFAVQKQLHAAIDLVLIYIDVADVIDLLFEAL